MSFLAYTLYNIVLSIALPFLWVAAYFNEKLGSSVTGQRNLKQSLLKFNHIVNANPKPVVWLHAASAGEFEQIVPLLNRLQSLDVYVFQTFTSATIFNKVSFDKRFDGVSFLPWDTYPRVNRFIKVLQPTLFINTRHDIWPNLLLALKRNGIRNILVNANLYEDSKRLLPLVKQINQAIFNNITHIYTGSASLKSLLNSLYDGKIEVVGDSRFDQVYERTKTNDSDLISAEIISDRMVIVYGSAIESDLGIITNAIAKALPNKEYLHVIVPHEIMERDLIPWEVEFFRHHIKTIRKTELKEYANESVIIWNGIGQLADLYKYAHLAFIGAGFGAGVHSVTEASIYNVPAAHGPKYDILAEAIELVDEQLSTVIHTADELATFLSKPDDEVQELSMKIEAFVSARIGATDRIIQSEFPLS